MIGRQTHVAAEIDGRNLKALRMENDVSRETFARLLGVPGDVLGDWEDGAPVPVAYAGRIADVALLVRHASRAAWRQRIDGASGIEILVDADLRIAAISRTARNTPFAREFGFDFPASVFVGAHMHSVLPNLDCVLIEKHGTGLNDLVDIGFFAGAIRFVRITAEINFGLYAYCGAFEYWPIETCDAGILARQLSLLDLERRTSLRQPGILVQRIEIVRRDAKSSPG